MRIQLLVAEVAKTSGFGYDRILGSYECDIVELNSTVNYEKLLGRQKRRISHVFEKRIKSNNFTRKFKGMS
jgi:hypothetical protein